MNPPRLYKSTGKIAFGYFFIYFNFDINTVNILPTFVGYLLILHAIRDLEQEESELLLLRPFGIILVIWHAATWVFSLFSVDLNSLEQIADILIRLINLYFHFQLLTNLASIASKYQSAGEEHDVKLLHCRTIQTVILTAVIFISKIASRVSEYAMLFSVIMVIIYAVVNVLIIVTLLKFRKSLLTEPSPHS
jgi:hypothetical protein